VPYCTKNIPVDDALKVLAERGVAQPHDELLLALRDGSIVAWGLVGGRDLRREAVWREIPSVWWRHVINQIENNTAFFTLVKTDPPTPWRAERIEVPRASIDSVWGVTLKEKPLRAKGWPPGVGLIAGDESWL
jgi:hypothetical protein